MTYFAGLFIVLCFTAFVLFIAFESLRIRRNGTRVFEARFWVFAFLFVMFLVFRPWVDAHLGSMYWRQTTVTDIAADALALLGLILAVYSRRALGSSWSSEVVIQKEHQLVERGPYAYIRHPMYSGLLLMLLGVAVFYGRYLWCVIFACCFAWLSFKARKEKRLFGRAFPGYAAYRRRTKTLIPFVW